MNLDSITRMLRPLSVRIANMVGRAVVKSADDSKKVQELQVSLLEGEVRDEVEHLQGYGFTSVPLEGAEAVVIFVGGRRDHGFCVGTDDRRHRPTGLQPGEVAVYNNAGAKIVIKASGDIEATPAAGKKFKVVGETELGGNVSVTGTLTASTDVVGGGKSLNTHTHSVAGGNAAGPVVFVPPALTGGPT